MLNILDMKTVSPNMSPINQKLLHVLKLWNVYIIFLQFEANSFLHPFYILLCFDFKIGTYVIQVAIIFDCIIIIRCYKIKEIKDSSHNSLLTE
jgi:hypothetical protein